MDEKHFELETQRKEAKLEVERLNAEVANPLIADQFPQERHQKGRTTEGIGARTHQGGKRKQYQEFDAYAQKERRGDEGTLRE